MNNSLDTLAHARQPLLDALAQMFTLYGWPDVSGRIYGLLLLEDDPLSLDEISDYLVVSKATTSTHVRMLESLHMVQRVRGPQTGDSGGGRPRAYFDAERDLMKVVQELLHHNARRESEIMKRGIKETRTRLQSLEMGLVADEDLGDDVRTDLEALDGFSTYLHWAAQMLWVFQSVERMQQWLEASDHSSVKPHLLLEVGQ